MAWFDSSYRVNKPALRIGHFTDTHLFATESGRYFEVDTAANMRTVLKDMAQSELDLVIFGGDLTQDHSHESYLHFARLLEQSPLECPLFWVPGNHDEVAQLVSLEHPLIRNEKRILSDNWQILLIDSKGPTPAGWVDAAHLNDIESRLNASDLPALCVCHHHPLPIDGYLDKHRLENGETLLACLAVKRNVKTLVHGHVHNEYKQDYQGVQVLATPATSIQFTRHTRDWQQENTGPAWRLIELRTEGQFTTEIRWLKS